MDRTSRRWPAQTRHVRAKPSAAFFVILSGVAMVAQLTIDFEIEKLVTKGRGRLRRASELVQPSSEALPPTDPHVRSIADVVRLTGQNRAILERLRKGPATNGELAAIALKYTSRISDLRQHGCVILCEKQSEGRAEYVLQSEPGVRRQAGG